MPAIVRERPIATRLKVRRFHVESSGEVLLVDDDGSCDQRHHTDGEIVGRWHRYSDDKGRFWVIVCPGSLSIPDRQSLIIDEPAGTASIEIAKRRAAGKMPARKADDDAE